MKRFICSLLQCFLLVHFVPAQNFTDSNLPIIVIRTNGQKIPEDAKIMARMGIVDNDAGRRNRLSDPFNHYDGWIGIEYRGSSSSTYDKKPYDIELRTANGNELEHPLLGMPEESDWFLISPFNDKTLMRDAITYTFTRSLGRYAARVRYCEMVLDGAYQGVYMLVENIKRDKNRVDISRLRPEDISGDELTGGYILRIDKFGPPPGGTGGHFQSLYPAVPNGWNRNWFQYHYPKKEDLMPEQEAYIQRYIRDFEDMMVHTDYRNKYADWIDVDSWVDYLLVQELSKNTDGYRLSAYFYKDRDSKGGKLMMGPVWDFNISFGIADYCDGASYLGWGKDINYTCGSDGVGVPFWWERLWNDLAFRQKARARWQELRVNGPWSTPRLYRTIDSIANLLAEAQVRNFQRWPILGTYVWPNAYIGPTYRSEVEYLKNWLLVRLLWLDENFYAASIDPDHPLPVFKMYPNPAKDHVLIENDYVPWREQWFDITLYDYMGKVALERRYSGTGIQRIELPRDQLPQGIYYYKVNDQQGREWRGKLMLAN
jgi:hypothetical protein